MELDYSLDFTDPTKFSYNPDSIKYTEGTFSLQKVGNDFITTSPLLVYKEKIFTSEITKIEANVTGDVTFILKVDADLLYWDGAAWSTSDYTYAQSNSLIEVTDNLSSLPAYTVVEFVILLNSSAGLNDATISSVYVAYEPVPPEETVDTVQVFLNVRDFTGQVEDITFTVTPSRRGMVPYKDKVILLPGTMTFSTQGGYCEIDLADNTSMPADMHYVFKIAGQTLRKVVDGINPRENLLDLADFV